MWKQINNTIHFNVCYKMWTGFTQPVSITYNYWYSDRTCVYYYNITCIVYNITFNIKYSNILSNNALDVTRNATMSGNIYDTVYNCIVSNNVSNIPYNNIVCNNIINITNLDSNISNIIIDTLDQYYY